MKDKFHDIVDYDFTADMESRLDKVESGEENWKKVLRTSTRTSATSAR